MYVIYKVYSWFYWKVLEKYLFLIEFSKIRGVSTTITVCL